MRGVYEKVKGSNDWYISYFDKDGRRHRQHVGRQPAAIEAYVNKKREIREGKFISPGERKNAPTFEQLFDMRMADPEINLRPSTARHLKGEFNCAELKSLKEMPAGKIRPQDISNVIRGLREREEKLSVGTILNYRALISAVFAYGVKKELLIANPVLQTRPPKREKDRVRFLSKEDEESIREKIRDLSPEREAEFDLLLHTGMRSGEAYRLTWDRVDLERGILDVPLSGKTGWRPIPINSICRKALETLHQQSRGSEFVIPRSGKENWMLGEWFGDAVEEAGVVRATPHTLRHTFASRLVMDGVDLRTVQQFLGHSSIVMTMRYAHLSPEHGKAAIERLVAPAAPAKRPPIEISSARAAGVEKVALASN
jgi:integrase